MWTDLLAALALVFVFEGIMPFAWPRKWLGMLALISNMPERQARFLGGFSMVFGLMLLYWVRG